MATLRLQVADATMQQHFQDTIAMVEFASLVGVPQVAYCALQPVSALLLIALQLIMSSR